MAEQRAAVTCLVSGGLSVQRACHLVSIHRSTFHYAAHPPDDTSLVDQIQALAVQHPRYGYRRMHVLRNRTQRVNQKRVRRLWRLNGSRSAAPFVPTCVDDGRRPARRASPLPGLISVPTNQEEPMLL